MAESVVVAGRVGRPHGLDGSFHVLEPVLGLLEAGRRVVVGGVAVEIVSRRGSEADPLVRLAGVADRDAAQDLRGTLLEVPRQEAPPLEDDEYYAADLVGCRVVDGAAEVGEVTALLALPSCEALEVAVPGEDEPVLVPLVRDAVRSVDVADRRIDVDRAFLGI